MCNALVEKGGMTAEAAEKLLATLELSSLEALEAVLGAESAAVRELKEFFALLDAPRLRKDSTGRPVCHTSVWCIDLLVHFHTRSTFNVRVVS